MDNPFDQQSEPSYFSPQPTRRGRRQQQRRLSSTESEESTTSSRAGSPEPDAQFALSMGNTPAVENPPVSLEQGGGAAAAANEDADEDDQVAHGGFVLPGLLGFGMFGFFFLSRFLVYFTSAAIIYLLRTAYLLGAGTVMRTSYTLTHLDHSHVTV